jgi:cell division protein FtsQ
LRFVLKQKIKKSLIVCFQLLLVAGLIVCLGFAADKQKNTVCTKLDIYIDNRNGDMFINNADVLRILDDQTGSPLGKKANQISLPRMEAAVESNPHVQNAEVWMDLNGNVSIKIKQKKAVLRIINRGGESFYLDENGFIMPLSEIYTAPVPVATGEITETAQLFGYRSMNISANEKIASVTVLDDLFRLVEFIEKDTFWTAQIQQIVVNEKSEISLVPTMGNHLIQFGKVEDVEEKFQKLMHFYLEGLNKTGWNNYGVINLKFKNQVVCVKKNFIPNQPVMPVLQTNPTPH